MAIRIDTAADLADMFGGQTDFEVAVTSDGPDGFEILGAGSTVAEAVADARETMRAWVRPDHLLHCVRFSGYPGTAGDCTCGGV